MNSQNSTASSECSQHTRLCVCESMFAMVGCRRLFVVGCPRLAALPRRPPSLSLLVVSLVVASRSLLLFPVRACVCLCVLCVEVSALSLVVPSSACCPVASVPFVSLRPAHRPPRCRWSEGGRCTARAELSVSRSCKTRSHSLRRMRKLQSAQSCHKERRLNRALHVRPPSLWARRKNEGATGRTAENEKRKEKGPGSDSSHPQWHVQPLPMGQCTPLAAHTHSQRADAGRRAQH